MTLLREAIRLTRNYVGERMLPAIPGWAWFDAIEVTGGFDGFGGCGCVLDPHVHGRSPDGGLRYDDPIDGPWCGYGAKEGHPWTCPVRDTALHWDAWEMMGTRHKRPPLATRGER